MVGSGGEYPLIVAGGSQAEVSRPAEHLEQLPPTHVARQTAGRGPAATWTRPELSHPRTAVRARCRVARGGMATSGAVARRVACAVSSGLSLVCGKAAEAAKAAGTAARETTQLQGGPSCGQRQGEKDGLKTYPSSPWPLYLPSGSLTGVCTRFARTWKRTRHEGCINWPPR